jgi:hypothetical protein
MMTVNKSLIDPPPEADNPEQSRRFIEIAREMGADETPGAFDRAFAKVIRPPLKKHLDDGETSQ